MKKIFFTSLLLCGLSGGMMAQEAAAVAEDAPYAGSPREVATSKILPQKGDIALGIGASSMLSYLGNLFYRNNDHGDEIFDYSDRDLPTGVVFGKYFIADDAAIRGSINFYADRSTRNYLVHDDAVTNNPNAYLSDQAKYSSSGFAVAVGYEKRRGYRRFQGLYGGEVFAGSVGKQTYEFAYANQMTTMNQNPTFTDFGQHAFGGDIKPQPATRIISDEIKGRTTYGVRGFIGAEYFIAPKFSIGGEFNWGLSWVNISNETVKYESWEPLTGKAEILGVQSKGDSEFHAGLGNLGGQLSLNIHF